MCPQYSEHPEAFSSEFWQSHKKPVNRKIDYPGCWHQTTHDQHEIGCWHGQQKGGKQRPFRPTVEALCCALHAITFRMYGRAKRSRQTQLTLEFSGLLEAHTNRSPRILSETNEWQLQRTRPDPIPRLLSNLCTFP